MENKKKNPLDELFRRKLNEEQLAPDDLLWDEIETKLEAKKPSRRFGLWFLLGALLLCGVASYFAFFNHSSINSNVVSEKVAPTENKISGNETPLNSTSTSTNSATDNNSSTANSTSNTTDSKSNSNTANKNSSIEKNNPSIGNQTSDTKNSSAGNQTTIVKNSPSGNLSVSNKNADKPIEKKSSNEIKMKNENSSFTNSNSVNDSKTGIDNSQKEISNSQSNSKNENGNSVSDNSLTKSENNPNDSITQTQNTNPTNNEITATTENKTLSDTAAIVKTVTPVVANPTPVAPVKKSKWFIEVGSSYLNNKSNLSASSSSTNQVQSQIDSVYYTNRNSNEKSASTLNFNFNIGMNVKNFQFKTGIEIMRFGENIQYDNSGLCFTVEGNPTLGYDTLQVHKQVNNAIGLRNGKSVNTYLGIPLQVNYSIPLKILKLQFGIGGFASTPLKWNSYYLNKTVTGLENPYDLKMINSIVLGYSFNVGVAVPVTKHFDAVLNYDFRHTMSPIEKTEYGTKKVFKSSGANLSLRYNF